MHPEHAHHEDMGGIESLIDIGAGFSDDDSDTEVGKTSSLPVLAHMAYPAAWFIGCRCMLS